MSELRKFYDSVRNLTPGETITYNNYLLEKSDAGGEISSPDHSEVGVYSPNGNKIESLSLNVLEFQEFVELLDSIVEEDPDTMKEWLNRED